MNLKFTVECPKCGFVEQLVSEVNKQYILECMEGEHLLCTECTNKWEAEMNLARKDYQHNMDKIRARYNLPSIKR